MVSLFEHRRLQARFSAVGMSEIFQTFAISNAGVSFVATTCAYSMGFLVRAIMLGG
jgi:energy-converting hydrogenase Eha subunit E